MPNPSTLDRKPSTGYLLTFAGGCIAIGFMGLAVEGRFGGGIGHRSAGAFSDASTVGLIFALGLTFVMRLIFWSRVPANLQRSVRRLLICVFVLSLALSLVLLGLCFSASGHGITATEFQTFTAVAAVLQITTVIWLVRYRQE